MILYLLNSNSVLSCFRISTIIFEVYVGYDVGYIVFEGKKVKRSQLTYNLRSKF